MSAWSLVLPKNKDPDNAGGEGTNPPFIDFLYN